jgi:hypothetical protein
MFLSKRNLGFVFALGATTAFLQHITAEEDVIPKNIRRANIAFDQALPMEIQDMDAEVSFSFFVVQ